MKRFRKVYSLIFAALLTGFSVYAVLDSFVIRRVYTVVDGSTTAAVETAAETVPELGQDVQVSALSSYRGGHGRGQGRGGNGNGGSEPDLTSSATSKSNRGGAASSDGSVPDLTSSATAKASAGTATSSAATVTGTSYDADGVHVALTTCRVEDTNVYVADITLDDPAALKTAFAQNSYGRNVTAATSDTASAAGAILAVNGDNYGAREKGYVIRNGVLYRDTAVSGQEDLVVYADGRMEIVNESDVTAQSLLDAGAVQVFSFGPGLVNDGEVIVGTTDEVGMAMASNPRTAIAMIEPGHYLLVVSDGRTSESEGLSLYELAQFLKSLGAETAYNLDGGGSSTMVFMGQVINNPTGGRRSGERAVTDIVYL